MDSRLRGNDTSKTNQMKQEIQNKKIHWINIVNPNKKDTLFYNGKIHVADYFFSHELPKMKGLSETLTNKTKITLDMPDDCFTD